MWLLSYFNCDFLCAIDVFTKYTCVKHLMVKKSRMLFDGFIRIINESKCKPNKLWTDQGRKIHKKHLQEWLYSNKILIYPSNNEDKLTN